MDLTKYLSDYSMTADKYLKKYFAGKRKEAEKIDPLAVDALNKLETFIYGGKKVRGALTVLGYEMVGGKNFDAILPVSVAIEIMHSSLLIHDDFIDNDEFRRGKPTIHRLYAQGKSEHFGASLSLLVGDVGIFLSNQIIAESEFEPELITEALVNFHHLLINTGYGEIMDVAFDLKDDLTWNDILNVRIYKTAHYTFVMPLTVGAILGGADKKVLSAIKKYGEPVGIGFQVRDDWLGVFGDPAKTGKSNESDIKEAKRTFLYLKTLELSGEKDSQFLKSLYSQRQIGSENVNSVRNIMEKCGAMGYSNKLASDLAAKGKKHVNQMTDNPVYRNVLSSFADFVVTRDK